MVGPYGQCKLWVLPKACVLSVFDKTCADGASWPKPEVFKLWVATQTWVAGGFKFASRAFLCPPKNKQWKTLLTYHINKPQQNHSSIKV